MKKRITGILLCLILLTLQIFTAAGTVYADGELEISTGVTGMTSEIGGKLFVAPMGMFNATYRIQNKSSARITIVDVTESRKGSNETFPIELNGEVELNPGESVSFSGRSFDAELANNPNTITCRVRYQQPDSQQTQEAVGQASVNVVDTGMNVGYTSSLQGPVFTGDQAALKAEVESRANVPLYNLTVTDSDLGKTLGTIDVLAPGQKKTVEATIPLEKSTGGNITIEYDDPMGLGEKFQQHFNTDLKIEVSQEAPVSSLTITGKPDKKLIPGPASVAFELRIKNTGNTVLKHLECLDWEGKVFHTYEQLQPGEEITALYTGTVSPEKSYELLAQAKVGETGQQIKSPYTAQLELLNPQVEIQRTIGSESIVAGEPFKLEYVVRNTGNVDLVDVVIEEPDFGEIESFDRIEAGGKVECSKELTIDEDAVSETTLTANDAEMDTPYSYKASEMKLSIGGGSHQKLSVVLTSDNDFLKKSGTVEMECTIKNTGQEPLYNLILTLRERDMVIDNISVLDPGEEKTIPVTPFRMEKTEAFLVEVNGVDADGEKFTVKSEPLTVEVGKGGLLSGGSSILRVVLIVIVLLCVLIIGALVYLIKGSGKFKFRKKRGVTNGR